MTASNGNTPVATDGRCNLKSEVTNYVINRLTGIDNVNGELYRSTAEQHDDGYVAVELRRLGFGEPDVAVRTLIHLTTPVIVSAEDAAVVRTLPVGVGTLDLPPDGDTAA